MNANVEPFDETFAALLAQAQRAPAAAAVDRRSFLKLIGATGTLTLGFSLNGGEAGAAEMAAAGGTDTLNAYVTIYQDGTIRVFAKMPDMGQGVKTSFAMTIAEELDADWKSVRVQQSPVNGKVYGSQVAGGSTSTPTNWDRLRQAGASARYMLVAAAAAQWGVSASELTTDNGKVLHLATKRSASYAELVEAASRITPPDPKTLTLKSRKDYKLLGTRVSGVDNLSIVTGKPLYGIDTVLPGLLYASLERCPARGGKPVAANLEEIKALPGIKDAFLLEGGGPWTAIMTSQNPPGVAIVGTSTWAVFSARKKLKVTWDESSASKDSWSEFLNTAQAQADQPGEKLLRETGNVDAAFAGAKQVVSATYQYSHAAHVPLEPQNTVAHYKDGKIEMWAPTQAPDLVLTSVAATLGIKPEDVTLHVTRSGGGFGRRLVSDYACEAAAIARHVNAPVKLQWTREDDIQTDFYRSGGVHAFKAALDANGKLSAWQNHFFTVSADGKGAVIGGGLSPTEFPATFVPNYRAWQTLIKWTVPFGPLRAPGSNVVAFAMQSFLHEVALAAKRDHLEFLIEQFANSQPGAPPAGPGGPMGKGIEPARAVAVIKLAAEKAGWGKPVPRGQALGLAFHFSHMGHFAEVARISVDASKKITVHEVTVVGDIGPIVNPSAAENQCQGAVIDGISAMMGQEILIENGRVQQSNFHNYPLLRITSAPPKINVHFIQTDVSPTGCGEPALPPLAPAVANALYTLTGKRVRTLPLSKSGYSI
jgi:isoquinoline 1-oxidoreductase beta subunit